MANHEGESSQNQLTHQYPHLTEQGIPHATLVEAFRRLIQEHQAIHAQIRSPHEPKVLPPATAVRSVLDWYAGSPNPERGDIFFTLRLAWDALVYERYEAGTGEEGLAGSILQAYAGETGESAIRLTDPMQVRVFDALAEAADIPHSKGQTEVPIPQKCQQYNRYMLSKEYQERFEQAQARRRRRT